MDFSPFFDALNVIIIAVAAYISYRAYRVQSMFENPTSIESRIASLEQRMKNNEEVINQINIKLSSISTDIQWLKKYFEQQNT